jgi:hypothetical protein
MDEVAMPPDDYLYRMTADRLAGIIAAGHGTEPVIVPVADELLTPAGPDETRAQLRREIAAGRHDTPIILAPGGMTAGAFRGGILVDAGPDVYQALAAKWMVQAMDALADHDEDLAQALLADVRTAVTLADTTAGGTR